MVYPFRDFNIKGVIWYQGEENSDRWKQYTPLFQAMIRDWRKLWNTNLPFYFVQLANWQAQKQVQPESTWAHLREAQANALQLENTGMAVAIDIGEAYDIHPKNKQEVGRRLALAALAQTYNKGKYQIPAYTKFRTEGRNAIIEFNQPITINGNEAVGFVMAGPDMIFHEAKATVKGNVAIVNCDKVDMPVAVRYAWADNPACNLQGNDNLPVAPFRTDSFE
jgi:sialate O-acetylesterase